MEPLGPDQYNTVTYLNPSTQDFEITYNGDNYGFIPAGQTKKMPKFLADFILKHLVDQCMNLLNQNTNNLVLRAEWEAKIKVGEEALVNKPVKTRQQILQEELDRLNAEGQSAPTAQEVEAAAREKGRLEADSLVDQLKATLPKSDEVPPQPVTPPTQTIPQDAVNLNNQAPTPTDVVTEPQVPQTLDNTDVATNQNAQAQPTPSNDSVPVETVSPTRSQLYDFARSQGVLDMSDPNTMNALENASLPELQNLVHWQS